MDVITIATEPPMATVLVKPPTRKIVLPLTVHEVIVAPFTEQVVRAPEVTVTMLGKVTLKLAPTIGFLAV